MAHRSSRHLWANDTSQAARLLIRRAKRRAGWSRDHRHPSRLTGQALQAVRLRRRCHTHGAASERKLSRARRGCGARHGSRRAGDRRRLRGRDA
eukprot:6009369-Prymnesium_polylepis.1